MAKMSAENEIEMRICDYLRRHGRSTVQDIFKELKLEKSTVNRHLYSLQASKQVFKTVEDNKRPVWDLVESMNDEQKAKPEQIKPEMTRDAIEEKHVKDLLKSGGLKASHIASKLGQQTQSTNKLLYGLMEKGEVRKCSKSHMWTLKNDQERNGSGSDRKLTSVSGMSQTFDVIAELGDGGYGFVCKVKHKIDDKIYAVKRVEFNSEAEPEVKALARLDHPNIVRYFTCWPDSDNWMSNQETNEKSNTTGSSTDTDDTNERSASDDDDDDDDDDEDDDVSDDVTLGMESLTFTESTSAAKASGQCDPTNHRTYLFIQMEFCEGGTLTSWIGERNYGGKQRIPLEIHRIFYEISSGVEYIHSNNLIHRDLKPDNILFNDGKVKIGDFGLVAAQKNPSGDPIERSKRKGTPTYMSPEQENLRNYDEKTDIFPLGLMWFEMLWKISSGMERAEIWTNLRNQKLPDQFCERYSAENKFIEKMLSVTPEDRPHAKDIRLNLETFFSLHQNSLSQKTI
nr:Z-DNA binding protein kinase [Danio rerio]